VEYHVEENIMFGFIGDCVVCVLFLREKHSTKIRGLCWL